MVITQIVFSCKSSYIFYTENMKYIIGLGNPGSEYRYTRHNVAWIIFDVLGLSDWKYDKYMNAEFIGEPLGGDIVVYIKPQTFMNRSGEIIPALKKQDGFRPQDIILLYDDIDLPFGEIKISYNRGDGGHNGVKSVTAHLGTKKTIRIRVGVSRLLGDGRLVKPNVLSPFTKKEKDEIREHISLLVKDIIKSLVKNGLEKTMTKYNRKK